MIDKTKMPDQGEMATEVNRYTIAQFRDGELALIKSTPGQSSEWGIHKHTRGLVDEGSRDCAIVTTESGRRFGLGQGVAIELPEIDKESGKFTSPNPVSGKLLNGILPEVTIGAPWELVGQEDPAKSILVRYTSTTPGSTTHEEIGGASPFPELSEMLGNASEKLRSLTPATGGVAIRASQA